MKEKIDEMLGNMLKGLDADQAASQLAKIEEYPGGVEAQSPSGAHISKDFPFDPHTVHPTAPNPYASTEADITPKLYDFLKYKEEPGEAAIQAFVAANGFTACEVLKVVYKMAHKHAQLMQSGRSTWGSGAVDPEELRLGTDHEREHTGDTETAAKIARDHISEHPKYYSQILLPAERAAKAKK